MIHQLINHLWQSTLFAAAAGLLTLAYRKNRAQVRYWLWFSASAKFLVPFALLLSLGSHLQHTPAPKAATRLPAPAMSLQVTEPFLDVAPALPPARPLAGWLGFAIATVWLCGFGVILLMRVRSWLRIQSTVRSSVPLDVPAAVDVRSAPGLLEPGVVGLLHPVLVLPAGIADRLTPLQLEAVLAHELCHVRRRDNLFAAMHMVVEAVCWFHPIVWWIGARLVEERERACDEEVLRLGNEPRIYAEGILNVCKFYVESPLVCVSGVTGADLKRRVRDILDGSGALSLSRAKRVALALAAAAALAAPVVVGVMNAPYIKAQSAAAGKPQFEVASIKTCGPLSMPVDVGQGGGGGKRSGAGGPDESPGSLYLPCLPVRMFIQMAYSEFANGQTSVTNTGIRVEGHPAWVDSERYSISAKAEGSASQFLMRGPMLQALLEDRFKLTVHRDTREVPVFELVVAKGGLKLTPNADGSCTPRDNTQLQTTPEPGKALCDSVRNRTSASRRVVDGSGVSMERLALMLTSASGRPVIDRTGITGRFAFHLEFAPLDAAPPLDGAEPAPSVFSAISALGLKLESAKGPAKFLVVDHVEKPSEN